jgi:hypothetical protein
VADIFTLPVHISTLTALKDHLHIWTKWKGETVCIDGKVPQVSNRTISMLYYSRVASLNRAVICRSYADFSWASKR